MSYTQVGACPKCGAPIWALTSWWSVLPPPSTHSCSCAGPAVQVVKTPYTPHNVTLSDPRDAEITALRAEIERWKWVARDVCAHTETDCPPECDSYGHAEHCGVYSVCQTVKNLRTRIESLLPLARFGKRLLTNHRLDLGDIDGGYIQDAAESCGLLAYVEVSEPCGEKCNCADYYGTEPADWPNLCLRETDAAKVEV